MNEELKALLQKAVAHKMTPEERRAQRISFVMGMLPFDSTITRQHVIDVLEAYSAEPPVVCPISSAVARDLAERAARGVVKYGVTLGEARLTHREVLQHAYEEALDFACYLKKALEEAE